MAEYTLILALLVFSFAMIFKPSFFAKPNSLFFRFMLFYFGYWFKKKSFSQIEAEKLVRKWGFLFFLIAVSMAIVLYHLRANY